MDPDFWNEPNVLRRGERFIKYIHEKFPEVGLLMFSYSMDPLGYEGLMLRFCKNLLKKDPEAGALFVINMIGIPYPGKRVGEFLELLKESVRILEEVYERTKGIGALLELAKAYELLGELLRIERGEEKEYIRKLTDLLAGTDLDKIKDYIALDEIAGFYHFIGGLSKPEEGIEYLSKAIEIRKRLLDEEFSPDVLSRLLESYFVRGEQYKRLGDFEKALKDYERVEELISKYKMTDDRGLIALANALISKAKLLLKRKELDEAEKECREAILLLEELFSIERDPFTFYHLFGAYQTLLSILFAKGKIEEGFEELKRKIEKFEAEYKERPRTLRELLLRPEVYSGLGIMAYNVGRLKEAIEMFTRAIERLEKLSKEVPESAAISEIYIQLANAYIYRGDAYKDAGNLKKGLEDIVRGTKILERIYEKNPNAGSHLALAYMYLGNLYKRMSMIEKSIEEYDKALEVIRRTIERSDRPEDRKTLTSIYINKALSFFYIGRYEEVKSVLEEAKGAIFKYGSGSEKAFYYLILGACDINQGKIEKGMENFDEALDYLKEAYDSEPINVIYAVLTTLMIIKKIGLAYPKEATRMLLRLREVPLPESIKRMVDEAVRSIEESS